MKILFSLTAVNGWPWIMDNLFMMVIYLKFQINIRIAKISVHKIPWIMDTQFAWYLNVPEILWLLPLTFYNVCTYIFYLKVVTIEEQHLCYEIWYVYCFSSKFCKLWIHTCSAFKFTCYETYSLNNCGQACKNQPCVDKLHRVIF